MNTIKLPLKFCCAAVICCCNCQLASAQDNCNQIWTDDGGEFGSYSVFGESEETFCPDNSGDKVSLTFFYIDIATSQTGCTDELRILDGENFSAPVIGTYCSEVSEGGLQPIDPSMNLQVGQTITATSESGCLTANFLPNSTEDFTHNGWVAFVHCAPPVNCAPPEVDLSTTLDCENEQYFTTLTVSEAPTADSIPTLTVEASINGDLIADTVFANMQGAQVTMGPFPSESRVVFSIKTPGYSCAAVESTYEVCAPPNASCSSALPIVNYATVTGNLTGASAVWYTYYSETPQTVSLYTCDDHTDMNTALMVYSGGCENLQMLDEYEEGLDETCEVYWHQYRSFFSFDSEANTTYYIKLTGYHPGYWYSSELNYGLSLYTEPIVCSAPDVNFDFADAEGNSLPSCAFFGDEIYVQVNLQGGSDNANYAVSVSGLADTLASGDSMIFGPFAAGPPIFLSVVGTEDQSCPITFQLTTVCPATLYLNTGIDQACLQKSAHILAFDSLSTNLVADINHTLAGTIYGLAAGTYDFYIKADGYLTVFKNNIHLQYSGNNLDIGPLIPGDVDNSNGINLLDASAMSVSFNSAEGSPDFNPVADFDCDNAITILDFSLIVPYFNTSGAEPPED